MQSSWVKTCLKGHNSWIESQWWGYIKVVFSFSGQSLHPVPQVPWERFLVGTQRARVIKSSYACFTLWSNNSRTQESSMYLSILRARSFLYKIALPILGSHSPWLTTLPWDQPPHVGLQLPGCSLALFPKEMLVHSLPGLGLHKIGQSGLHTGQSDLIGSQVKAGTRFITVVSDYIG